MNEGNQMAALITLPIPCSLQECLSYPRLHPLIHNAAKKPSIRLDTSLKRHKTSHGAAKIAATHKVKRRNQQKYDAFHTVKLSV